MSICKINVSTDEKEYFWIIVENKKIINMNATREEIRKISRTIYYNPTNVCPICREEKEITDRSILYPGNARKYKDGDGVEKYVF